MERIFEGRTGTFLVDEYVCPSRFYMLEMTRAFTGQNARENALVKRRVSKEAFLSALFDTPMRGVTNDDQHP